MENSFEERMRYERARKKVKAIRGYFIHLFAYLVVNGFLITSKWVNLQPEQDFLTFSTFSTAFFWGIGLAFHTFGVFGILLFLGSNWEEQKITQMMAGDARENKKWE
ncbi:2TM domain-containing protein [Flavobacterium litorale]|uniref:2TM domain-containing protein n=1 Tax=Flavobacterium litorale TaxID=2856519 RepID=A0ABX8V3P8_9FLAO|nr:2TM domain-containing protein [Flavobacterium litorale]QYJ67447.1 2TM domain-containing protein [Flavobacterium litorale]